MFDLSIPKFLILAVIGLMIFGPHQLPRIASQAGRALRELRRLADNAKADLTEGLGPEFRDFDFNDLNPRSLVRKHLLSDIDEDDYRWPNLADRAGDGSPIVSPQAVTPVLEAGEIPPYDIEAT